MTTLVQEGDLSIEWFGCTTFRIRVSGRTLLFDAYLTKVPGAEPAGLGPASAGSPDFVFVSHSHFDHMVDAAPVAATTGAAVVGSYETARILRANGLADEQILPVSGGETVDCGAGVRVRVLPGLHSCLFARAATDSGTACLGDLGVPVQERVVATRRVFERMTGLAEPSREYFAQHESASSRHDGGPLVYLLETTRGSVLLCSSSGHWSGLMSNLRPDLAVLAMAGRPNLDGEPFQGSLAQFLLLQAEALRPQRVALCHHDALLPDVMPAIDTGEALSMLAREASYARHTELALCEPMAVSF
jgi:L-ascorbate metabolism protein UlaG (beta-lactamase superfamily)